MKQYFYIALLALSLVAHAMEQDNQSSQDDGKKSKWKRRLSLPAFFSNKTTSSDLVSPKTLSKMSFNSCGGDSSSSAGTPRSTTSSPGKGSPRAVRFNKKANKYYTHKVEKVEGEQENNSPKRYRKILSPVQQAAPQKVTEQSNAIDDIEFVYYVKCDDSNDAYDTTAMAAALAQLDAQKSESADNNGFITTSVVDSVDNDDDGDGDDDQ